MVNHGHDETLHVHSKGKKKKKGPMVGTKVHVQSRSRTTNFGDHDKSKNDSRDKSRGTSKPRKEIECYPCGKMEHKRRECRKLQVEQKKGKGSEKRAKKVTSAKNMITLSLFCCIYLIVN